MGVTPAEYRDKLRQHYYWTGVELQLKKCRLCHFMPSAWPAVDECAHGRSIQDPDRVTDCGSFNARQEG